MLTAKNGDLESPTYLDWIRRQRCYFCDLQAPSSAHHWPTKGSLGYTNDLQTIPVCGRCHMRCHGETVGEAERLLPIPRTEQHGAPAQCFWRFVTTATHHEYGQVMRELTRWRNRPLAIPI